jgi:hypothetical protein
MAGPIRISILADAGRAVKSLGDADSKLGRLGSTAGKLKGPLAAVGTGLGIGLAAVAVGVKSILSSASDAEQSIGATETVFGNAAKSIISTSDDAARKYGLSANSYRESANLIGSLFKNQGVSVDALAGKTDTMIGTAADLAATFGGETKDAVEALGSAFKGEFDPLERYGISLKESTVQAELAKRGQDKLTGAALAQAKQMVVTDLITKQAGGALGAFGRESNTLAGQQQRLTAKVENLKAALGTRLLPVATRFIGFLSDKGIPALSRFADFVGTKVTPKLQDLGERVVRRASELFEGLAGWAEENRDSFSKLATEGEKLGRNLDEKVLPALEKLGPLLKPLAGGTAKEAGNNLARINSVLAGPQTTDVTGWANFGTKAINAFLFAMLPPIKPMLDKVGEQVGIGGRKVGDLFSKLPGQFKTAMSLSKSVLVSRGQELLDGLYRGATSRLLGLGTFFRGLPGRALSWIGGTAKTLYSKGSGLTGGLLTGAASVGGRLATFFSGLPGKALSAVGGVASTLYSKGSGLVGGLLTGARSVDFGSFFSDLPGRAARAVGSTSSLLFSAGADLLGGMISGVQSMAGRLVSSVTGPVGDAISKAKGLLGINSPSRVFREIGRQTVQGLEQGLSRTAGVQRAAAALAGATTDGFGSVGLSAAVAFSGSGSGAGTQPGGGLTINVYALADGPDVGRRVKDALVEYERYNGAGWRS